MSACSGYGAEDNESGPIRKKSRASLRLLHHELFLRSRFVPADVFSRLHGRKTSLTIELDQHTADAGIDTRVEAAIDIMQTWRRRTSRIAPSTADFKPARTVEENGIEVVSSDGSRYPLTHPRVEVVFPSMGRYGTEVMAALFRGMGITARALPIPGEAELSKGRAHASCKECLPYVMTTGPFLTYLKSRPADGRITLCFLTTGGGPCRMGQYTPSFELTLRNARIPDAAVLNITDENGFGGLGKRNLLRAWQAIVISDIFADIKSVLTVTARDPKCALEILEDAWRGVIRHFETTSQARLIPFLKQIATRLAAVPLARNPRKLPVISIIGEIFVRREEFSRRNIIEFLEKNGFVARVAPVAEYMCYSNYVINENLGEWSFTPRKKTAMRITALIQRWWEWRIKRVFAGSDLIGVDMIDISDTVNGVKHLIDRNFRGETILTIGLGMRDIFTHACGVISIGPFGCMPSRIADSVLRREMNAEGKRRMAGHSSSSIRDLPGGNFPFLSIETDGSDFPLIVVANLEAFVLKAGRMHELMRSKSERKHFQHV